jgi:ABC-type sulfate/molybdate transport systems ATPase subunit
MARIACRQLTKKYGNVTAVDRLDLEIRDTEFMVLLGPSGCGKTTTLNVIAGLEELTVGDVYFDDRLPPNSSRLRTCSGAGLPSFPAASASAWRSAGRSCASRRHS